MRSNMRLIVLVMVADFAVIHPGFTDPADGGERQAGSERQAVQLTFTEMDTVTAGAAYVDLSAYASAFGFTSLAKTGTHALAVGNRYADFSKGSANAFSCCLPNSQAAVTATGFGVGDTVLDSRLITNNRSAGTTFGSASAYGLVSIATLSGLPVAVPNIFGGRLNYQGKK